MSFSPDGKTLAIAGGEPGESGTVELWSWPEKKKLGVLTDHEDVVYDVEWIQDQGTLVTASADSTMQVWNVKTKKNQLVLKGHSGPILALALSPDGKTLCSGSVDQTIRVWDTATWKLRRTLNNHLGQVHALAYRPAQNRNVIAQLASAGEDKTVRIWQPEIGRMVCIVRHPVPVLDVAWNRRGSKLYSAGKDGALRTIVADDYVVSATKQLSSRQLTCLAVYRGKDQAIAVGRSEGDVVVVKTK